MSVKQISKQTAKEFLLGHLLLKNHTLKDGKEGAIQLLHRFGCIQLDTLDPFGNNSDLILGSRVDQCHRGDFFRFLKGHGFEHWAKERCFISEKWFPKYAEYAKKNAYVKNAWWNHEERISAVPKDVIESIYKEVVLKGPIIPNSLSNHGSVEFGRPHMPKKMTVSALDILWIQCKIAIIGRAKTAGDKYYQIPQDAFSKEVVDELRNNNLLEDVSRFKESKDEEEKSSAKSKNSPKNKKGKKETSMKSKKSKESKAEEDSDFEDEDIVVEESVVQSKKIIKNGKDEVEVKEEIKTKVTIEEKDSFSEAQEAFYRWAIVERVNTAGILTRNSGPQWSVIDAARRSYIVEDLIKEELVEQIVIEGSSTKYLVPKGFSEEVFPDYDDRMRILAPLDPVMWDRKLVEHLFDFEYTWEVYKKKENRRWGYYVCPILHKGEMVGRLEGRLEDDVLKIHKVFKEKGHKIKLETFKQMLERHKNFCNASKVEFPNKNEWITEVPPLKPTNKKRKSKDEESEEEDEEEIPKKKTKLKVVTKKITKKITKKSSKK